MYIYIYILSYNVNIYKPISLFSSIPSLSLSLSFSLSLSLPLSLSLSLHRPTLLPVIYILLTSIYLLSFIYLLFFVTGSRRALLFWDGEKKFPEYEEPVV